MRQGAASFRLPGPATDALIALFVTTMQLQGNLALQDHDQPGRALAEVGHLGYVLLALSGLVLVVRRRWPLPVFVITAVASLVYYGLDFPDGPGWLGLFVALYSLTAYGDGRRSVLVAATGISVLAVGWLVAAADIEPRAAIGWVFFRIGASVMSAALGESVRTRRYIAAEAHRRAERAEQTREQEARARVDAERLRIAREVHDTVAHAIAVINVQAGVTAHVLDKRPERARETLEVIERTSSQALREMRAVLGVLCDSHDDRVPRPGLDRLDELVASAREAGLDLKVESTPAPATGALSSAVDSAAYRVVQESLTNVIRHVGPTRVLVSVHHGREALEVCVVNEARRETSVVDGAETTDGLRETARRHLPDVDPAADAGRSGRGIPGMRERCQLLGGDLTAQPLPEGGFIVKATLPRHLNVVSE